MQGVVDAIEAQLDLVDLFYARDLLVTFRLTDIIVRHRTLLRADRRRRPARPVPCEWNANQAACSATSRT